MAKLFVIATGLGVLVDREDRDSPVSVLLRRVLKGAEVVGMAQEEVPPHEPFLRLRPDGVPILIGGKEVRFLTGAVGKPRIVNGERFLPVGPRLSEAGRIDPDFLGAAILREGSRVILAGADGVIEPIHIDGNDSLDRISFDIGVFLSAMFDPDTGGRVDRNDEPIANGVLYSLDLADERGAPVVEIGSERFDPTSIPAAQLGGLRSRAAESNYVIWIVNVASEGFLDPQLVRDIDFYLLYNWLVEDVNPRFIPETARQRMTGEGDPPGQCMFGGGRV